MPDLAGYDLILEFHIETIEDFLNLVPVTNPVDGKSIYLCGGPFSTDLAVDLGPRGQVTCRLMITPTLHPIQHQSLTRVVLTFEGGTSGQAGPPLQDVRGSAEVDVPMSFVVSSGTGSVGRRVPAFEYGYNSPAVTLDAQSRSEIDSAWGAGAADSLTKGLVGAVASFLAAAGTKSLPVREFTVVPGVDSHDVFQLSAMPSVVWIDDITLGVYGYYRAAATGGNLLAKSSGDLGQSREEFFYNQPGLFSIVPGRRFGLLLSPEAFELVIACPAVRDQVVQGLVYKREHRAWLDWIASQPEGKRISDDMYLRLPGYLLDEEQNHPDQSWWDHHAKAEARVQHDIGVAIEAIARAQESTWLRSAGGLGPESIGGQQAISDAVPPPCGTGAVEIDRIDVEHTTSDVVPMLRRLDVRLAAGQIEAHFEADGMLQMLPGDVSFTVAGVADILLWATNSGQIGSSFSVQPPSVTVSATGFTGSVIALWKDMTGSGSWAAVMAFLGVVLQQELTTAILGHGFPHATAVGLPQQPFPARIVDVLITPAALFIAGLVCREPRWNDFNPGLFIETSEEARVASSPPQLPGTLALGATPWGCVAASFSTTRNLWDETFLIRARLRDAPLPITIVNARMELGNFSWIGIAGTHVLDPRPTWSSQPVALEAETLTMSGEVEHLDILVPPYLRGPLTEASVIVVVTGDMRSGWHATFRGLDGNFYVKISVDALDGDARAWHAETFIIHDGEQLELPPDYYTYKADCDAKATTDLSPILAGSHLVAIG